MKHLKKALAVLLGALLVFSAAACFGGEEEGDFVDDEYLATLDGAETEVSMLYVSGMGIGAGYADELIPAVAARMTNEDVENGYNDVAQYFVTKAAYNYNVDNNDIRLRFLDWGWEDELAQRMTAAYASWNAGTRPQADVVVGEIQMLSYARQGGLVKFPQELEDWVRANMLPSSYAYLELEDDDGDGLGEIYGCAPDASPQVLLWNKTILRACGVDEEIVQNGPSTWQEWLDVCEQVGSTRGYYAGGVYCGANDGGVIRAYPFVAQTGATLQDADGDPYFDSEGAETALSFIRDLSETNVSEVIVSGANEDEYHTYFYQQKTAFMTGPSYQIGIWQDTGNDIENLGWCALPTPSADSGALTNLIGAFYLAVPNWNTDKQEEAFAVIKSYFSEEVQRVIGERDFKPVNNRNVAAEDWYSEKDQYFAYEIMANDEIVYMPGWDSNQTSIWAAFQNALLQAGLYRTYGSSSIADILAEAQRTVSAYIG